MKFPFLFSKTVVETPLAEIEVKVDETCGEKTYFVYYEQYNLVTGNSEGYDTIPQVKLPRGVWDDYEAFSSLDEAKDIIQKYGYTLSHVVDNT